MPLELKIQIACAIVTFISAVLIVGCCIALCGIRRRP
jgi:hypothetical protein